ncbi:MAG: ribonuclease P protein component [bacterium]|nr:ribonuclease P protein component [bacterium]
MALSKENRLTKKTDFNRVFKEGNAVKGNFLFIRYIKNASINSRFAFVIPIKIAGSAVARNRTKRSFSELIRKNINRIKNNYDLVAIVKKKEKDDILKLELIDLLSKATIIK